MTVFAVLAEDRSDAETLDVLVKRIGGERISRVHSRGFGGCGELCRKAGAHIELFSKQGATHIIICYDSDGNDPSMIRDKVRSSVSAKIDLKRVTHEIIVPVEELEAWIIADESAIKKAIPTLSIQETRHPETIKNPKEWLINQSRGSRSRPLYAPATFNRQVAKHIDIAKVEQKCPSFRELTTFVRNAP